MAGFYLIKSRLSDLFLDVEGSKTTPGAKVLPWKKHGGDNQLWYDDPATGTIRSKLNEFCLDVEGDQLVLKPYRPGDVNQQWERHEQFIRNRTNNKRVLDVFGKNKSAGAKIGAYDFNGGPNQSWEFEFVGGHPGVHPSQTTGTQPRRDFFIVSELNKKVVDIQAGSRDPDAKILVWTRDDPPKRNQLWYTDEQGFIRSAHNNMVFHNSELGDKLKTKPISADPRGHWAVVDKRIVNGLGECLDIKGEKDEDGAKLISYTYKGAPNQHWHLQYL